MTETPTTPAEPGDPDELAAWIRRAPHRASLELYLETFAHTVDGLQERDAVIRVAAQIDRERSREVAARRNRD